MKVDACRLQPYTTYWFAFEALGVRSPVGRTRTAPAPGQDVGRLRFAVVTCAKYDAGYFPVRCASVPTARSSTPTGS